LQCVSGDKCYCQAWVWMAIMTKIIKTYDRSQGALNTGTDPVVEVLIGH
jgi:hypothetical protein